MPGPFVFSPYTSPYVGSIANLMQAPAQAQAQAALTSGQAFAGAAQQTGQAVSGAIQQATDPRRQFEQRQLDDMKALDKAFQMPGGRDAIINALPGHLRPTVMKQFNEADESAARVQEATLAAEKATTEYVGGLADNIVAHNYDPSAAQLALSHAKATFRNNPSLLNQVTQIEQHIQGNPTPDGIKAIVDPILQARDATEKPIALGREGSLVTPHGKTLVAPTVAPTAQPEANVVFKDDKGVEHPVVFDKATQKYTYNGQDVTSQVTRPTENKGSAEQDDQRYRGIIAAQQLGKPITPEDAAWAKGYETQKTLGPEATAAGAANRQADTIAQQNKLTEAHQIFEQQTAGRKELTEKVEQPYQTALTSAQTLRDAVAAARAGNKTAAALQSLETTMAAIRAQGLNRINTVELGVSEHAGSLWDRIQGVVGKAASGQSISADVQKDMEQFAGLLEKAAYKKYSDGFASTTKRYKLGDEQKLPGPASTTGVPKIDTYERGADGKLHKVGG